MIPGFKLRTVVHIQKDGMKMYCGLDITGKKVEPVDATGFRCADDYTFRELCNKDVVIRCSRCDTWYNYGKKVRQ